MKKLLCLSLFLLGCTSTEDVKPKSEWAELDGVSGVNCAYWPMQKADLGMNALIPVHGVGSGAEGLVASMRMRNTSSGHYYAPFSGKVKLDPDDFKKLDLGRGAVVIGGVKTEAKTLIAVVQHRPTKAILELRNPDSNVVVAAIESLPGQASVGAITNVSGGFWLSMKHHEQRSSVLYVAVDGGSAANKTVTLKVTKFEGLKLTSFPVVLAEPNSRDAVVVVYDSVAAGKGKKEVFSVSKLNKTGGFTPLKVLPVKVESEVESFSAAAHGGKYFIGYIDGDSMVGQGKLRSSRFAWDDALSIIGEDSKALGDVHVSEPVWIAGGAELYLGILKWVDEESTLATYRMEGSTLVSSKSSGVFAKGSRIANTFTSKDGRSFISVRFRDSRDGSEVWKFRLCHLKGLTK